MYVSIDIETTGLNTVKDQVLEFAAVVWDHEDVMDCSFFECRIYWERLQGQPYALWLNRDYIEALKDVNPDQNNGNLPFGWLWPSNFGKDFRQWLDDQGICKAHALGKNYAGFDELFLKRMNGWPDDHFKTRYLDVGTLAANRLSIPSLFDIKISRAIPGLQHSALHDARYALQVAIERLK